MLSLLRRLNSGVIYLWKLEWPILLTLFKKTLKTYVFSQAFHSKLSDYVISFFFLFTFSMTVEGVPYSKAFYSYLDFLIIYTTHDVIRIYHLVILFFIHCCNAQLIISSRNLRNINTLRFVALKYCDRLVGD